MHISLNPLYFCNFRCGFCYLTPEQLGDQKKISLEDLDRLLSEVVAHEPIEHIDLYGGEIGALKQEYYDGMMAVVRKYFTGKVNIVTNYSMLSERFFADDVTLSISYDFEAREKSELVYKNMMLAKKDLAVLVLASKEVCEMDVDYMINMLNLCSAVTSVEIKPYSTNQANCHNVTHRDFEEFVLRWLDSPVEKKFKFINQEKIEACLDKSYNAFSDNHVYITPNGRFAVLEFDLNDREFFKELDTFDEYLAWSGKEKQSLSPICEACPFKGHCLTEHYRYVKDLDNGCNGYRLLLESY